MSNDVYEHVDQHRWLLNNGLFTDQAKDTLYLYGAIINQSITAVEVSVNSNTKIVKYIVYAPNPLLRDYNRYQALKGIGSILGMWKLKRLLKRHGNLEFLKILSGFVKTYCGPAWSVELELKESSEYEDQRPPSNDGSKKDRDPVPG